MMPPPQPKRHRSTGATKTLETVTLRAYSRATGTHGRFTANEPVHRVRGNAAMRGGTTEETVLMCLDIPAVPGWKWLADCNILVVSTRLSTAEHERAIDDAQATWRRQFIRAVPSPSDGDGDGHTAVA